MLTLVMFALLSPPDFGLNPTPNAWTVTLSGIVDHGEPGLSVFNGSCLLVRSSPGGTPANCHWWSPVFRHYHDTGFGSGFRVRASVNVIGGHLYLYIKLWADMGTAGRQSYVWVKDCGPTKTCGPFSSTPINDYERDFGLSRYADFRTAACQVTSW